MWGKSKKRPSSAKIDTLIGQQSEIQGNVEFVGGLHVDGIIKGNVMAEDDSSSMLTLSEHGRIEGEVRVPYIILNGVVVGDVHASARVELAPQAKISGNVYYSLIEMAMGSEVNGKLLHRLEVQATVPTTGGGSQQSGKERSDTGEGSGEDSVDLDAVSETEEQPKGAARKGKSAGARRPKSRKDDPIDTDIPAKEDTVSENAEDQQDSVVSSSEKGASPALTVVEKT